MVAFKFKSKYKSYIGTICFFILATCQFFMLKERNLYFSLFISSRFLIVAFFYFIRESSQKESSIKIQIISWVGALLPFLYTNRFENLWQIPFDLTALMLTGSLISISGILSLGKSFGISPAKRTIVKDGLYKYIKHPIYTGYLISELSIILSLPSSYNLLLFVTSAFLYYKRSEWENTILHSNDEPTKK